PDDSGCLIAPVFRTSLYHVGRPRRGTRARAVDTSENPMNPAVSLRRPRHAACASRDMRHISRLRRRSRPAYRFAAAFVLGLALVVAGASYPGRVDGTVSAQTLTPCALLM